MTTVRMIEYEEASAEVRAVFDDIMESRGIDFVPNFWRTIAHHPPTLKSIWAHLKAAMAHTRKSMDPVFGHVFIYEHCLPFDVSRAYDEARGIKNPRVWTAERDQEMWSALQD